MRTASITVLPDDRAPTRPKSGESCENPSGSREWHWGHRRTPVGPKHLGHSALLASRTHEGSRGMKAG